VRSYRCVTGAAASVVWVSLGHLAVGSLVCGVAAEKSWCERGEPCCERLGGSAGERGRNSPAARGIAGRGSGCQLQTRTGVAVSVGDEGTRAVAGNDGGLALAAVLLAPARPESRGWDDFSSPAQVRRASLHRATIAVGARSDKSSVRRDLAAGRRGLLVLRGRYVMEPPRPARGFFFTRANFWVTRKFLGSGRLAWCVARAGGRGRARDLPYLGTSRPCRAAAAVPPEPAH
jgi:hypothetical protein